MPIYNDRARHIGIIVLYQSFAQQIVQKDDCVHPKIKWVDAQRSRIFYLDEVPSRALEIPASEVAELAHKYDIWLEADLMTFFDEFRYQALIRVVIKRAFALAETSDDEIILRLTYGGLCREVR